MMKSNGAAQLPTKNLSDWAFSDTDTFDISSHDRYSDGLQWTCVQTEASRFRGHLTELRIGKLYVTEERVNQGYKYNGEELVKSLIFHIDMSARCKMHYRGQAIEKDKLTVMPGKVMDFGYISGPLECLFVTIDEKSFLAYSQHVLGHTRPLDFLQWGREISESETVNKFRCCLQDVLSDLVAHPDAINDGKYQAKINDKIMRELITVLYFVAPQGRQLPRPTTRSFIVNKAIDYMESHLAESISIADVCRTVRVSRRTLSYSFGEVVGVSPVRYLLTARLSRVHRELIRLGEKRHIYCIAQRYGFNHMGRFAQYYYKAYGELPSETCCRVKKRFKNRNFIRYHDSAALVM